jgi:argininosuccinate lyase
MCAALDPAMLATDLADYLVDKGISFRQAHKLVGQAVRAAGEQGIGLDMLPLVVYQQISPFFDSDVYKVFDPRQSIARRTAYGGTAPQAVREQLQLAQSIWKANYRKGSV